MVQLGVFAKYWQSGKVKTRLADSVGTETAAELYRLFLETVLRRSERVAIDCRVLAYSPPDKKNAFDEIAGSQWSLQPQSGSDLGERMAHYFECSFANGASRVVLIGSDSPDMPMSRIHDAFEALNSTTCNSENADIVLGPSADGGYYLVGMREFVPQIFKDIDWSTPDVYRQTMAAAQRTGKSVHTLDAWYDVDTVEDLQRLAIELSAPHFDSVAAAAELLERIEKI